VENDVKQSRNKWKSLRQEAQVKIHVGIYRKTKNRSDCPTSP